MHIYFINYHRFQESSGIHIHFLANTLEEMGIPCTVCVPSDPQSVHDFGLVNYRSMSFARLRCRAMLSPKSFSREKAIFHAWTPRERVRKITIPTVQKLKCPYFVHLEDNEERIYESQTGISVNEQHKMSWLRKIRPANGVINPKHYRGFMADAAGVTCIMDSLEEKVPGNVAAMTFWPACESDFFKLSREPDRKVLNELCIPETATVITYTGNIHAANTGEIETLYEAVAMLNTRGVPVRLLRCGGTYASLDKAIVSQSAPYVVELGSQNPTELIKFVSAANILVQPGKADPFNNYRFPSKIPMYLASGRPVILPKANIGTHLTHNENCLLLSKGTAEELVAQVQKLLTDPQLQRKIGDNGREFAQNHFSWQKSAVSLLDFYRREVCNWENR